MNEEELNRKLDAIYVSVEKTRKYFLWAMIVSIGAIVIPVIGIAAMLPWLMSTLSSAYGGLL